MTNREEKFIQIVWEHYKRHGRHDHPWRLLTSKPEAQRTYEVLVSEMMLQQTQVDRVIPKYTAFIKKFPSVEILAKAPLGDVIRSWQGLGYNRRARLLHLCARTVVNEHNGVFPKTHKELMELPGIGPYTAGAVMAFSYNMAEPIIETNIRSVYIHHFFKNEAEVLDADILKRVTRTLDIKNPRDWYYALMDYGVDIKKEFGNPNKRSRHHVFQKPFKGSDREIRGAILRTLAKGDKSSISLNISLDFDTERLSAQLENLEREGMIIKKKRKTRYVYTLP